eukprot:g9376.t2
MAESSSSGLLRSLIKDSGTCAGNPGFREWKLKLREAINFHSSELLSVLNGTARPTETATSMDAVAAWDKANSRPYSLLFFATTGPAQQTVRTQAGKEPNSTGNGAAAWKALNARFDAHTQEARRACHRDLFNLRHNAGQDPIDFFTKGWDLRLRLKVLGEEVSDDVYLDIMLSGLTEAPEFKFIREIHYRSEFTSVDRLQETANRFYVDKQSRNESGPVVSGRGAAMAAASSTDQCHHCKAYGHFQRDCPQQVRKNRSSQRGKKPGKHKRGSGGSGQPKWCSYHNTTSHSDAECHKQLALRTNKQKELQGLAANLALLQSAAHAGFSNPGGAHLVQSSPAAAAAAPAPLAQSSPAAAAPAPTEPPSFGFSYSALISSLPETGSKPAASSLPPQDHRLPSGFFGAFMATPAELSLAPFRSDGSSIRMVVDSGATGNYLDPALTPGLRSRMRDVEDLRVPHTIVAAGQQLLHGVTAGTILGTVTDDSGNDRHVSLRIVLVPRLGTNLFSVTAAMLNGVASLFYPTCPRLESEGLVIPMQSHGVDGSTGKLVCSIQVRLRAGTADLNAPAGLALKVESASLWHRRMGHINAKSLDVLRKQSAGVEYAGDLKDCSVCPLGKSAQQPHAKQAACGVLRPFQLVTVDTLGPFTPVALGGFKYAVKFVDQQTKWKEVVLTKDKTHAVDALELFNKGTVIPTGERIHCIRADQGTEFTSAVYRQYCQDVGIQLQFASPNTPQQIGANERAGRTIVNIVRCMFADSTLPNFLWGELMQTAVYLSNRTPHAALHNGTPYKALYGKEAYLGHVRDIGSRAFVHEETHTRKLEHRAWEGRLVGYSTDSKSYRVYNAATRRVRVSRNVVFIETPPAPPSLDERGFDDGEFNYGDHDEMEFYWPAAESEEQPSQANPAPVKTEDLALPLVPRSSSESPVSRVAAPRRYAVPPAAHANPGSAYPIALPAYGHAPPQPYPGAAAAHMCAAPPTAAATTLGENPHLHALQPADLAALSTTSWRLPPGEDTFARQIQQSGSAFRRRLPHRKNGARQRPRRRAYRGDGTRQPPRREDDTPATGGPDVDAARPIADDHLTSSSDSDDDY